MQSRPRPETKNLDTTKKPDATKKPNTTKKPDTTKKQGTQHEDLNEQLHAKQCTSQANVQTDAEIDRAKTDQEEELARKFYGQIYLMGQESKHCNLRSTRVPSPRRFVLLVVPQDRGPSAFEFRAT